MLSTKLFQQIPLKNCFYEEIKSDVFASIHKFENIIGVLFEENYPNKKLQLKSVDCYF